MSSAWSNEKKEEVSVGKNAFELPDSRPPEYNHHLAAAPIQLQPINALEHKSSLAPPMLISQSLATEDSASRLARELQLFFINTGSFAVSQHIELCEIFCGCESRNRYSIKNDIGQVLLYAIEGSTCVERQLCGSRRRFRMKIKDVAKNTIFVLKRPTNCSWFCGWLCQDKVTVYDNQDQKLGSIRQNKSIFKPSLTLMDATDQPVLKIRGPCWPCCTCSWFCACNDVDYAITSISTGATVGFMKKRWSGCLRECYTDAEKFGMEFPKSLDPAMKVVCLAALLLIDFEYYEIPNFYYNCLGSMFVMATSVRV